MTSIAYNSEEDVGVILYEKGNDSGVSQMIQFQHGPVGESGYNGVQSEDVLELLIKRTEALDQRMPCDENREAIRAMNQALDWFAIRTSKRKEQGVEGTNRPHITEGK